MRLDYWHALDDAGPVSRWFYRLMSTLGLASIAALFAFFVLGALVALLR